MVKMFKSLIQNYFVVFTKYMYILSQPLNVLIFKHLFMKNIFKSASFPDYQINF